MSVQMPEETRNDKSVRGRMNFIFHMPDSLRAESIGCYGHASVQTPNFDRVAKEGVVFEQCFSQSPFCTPSRCSMVTGLYPHVHGHRTMEYFLDAGRQPSLFRYLKDAGYHVEWIGKNDMYDPASDMAKVVSGSAGYQTYARERLESGRSKGSLQCGQPACEYGTPGYYNFMCKPPRQEGEFDITQTRDGAYAATAVEFLRSAKAKTEPFALFIAGVMPHPPYGVPDPWYSMYDPSHVASLRGIDLPGAPAYRSVYRTYFGWDLEDEQFFKRMQAVYLGMVSYTDMLFGHILSAVDDNGLADRTAVFVFSDHGDYGGDYGIGHKCVGSMEDVHLRIPFIARVPGMKSGHRVSEPIELFDIMPTTLDLAGVPCTHQHFAKTLTPQLAGAPGDPDRAVYAEGGFPEGEPHLLDFCLKDLHDPKCVYHPLFLINRNHPETQRTCAMMRFGRYKLVYRWDENSELYDMCEDPREERNLYSDAGYASVRCELTSKLLKWYMETSDLTPYERQSRAMPPIVPSIEGITT